MRVIYGPVPSWRLGRSLGVDPLGGGRSGAPSTVSTASWARRPPVRSSTW